MQSEAQIEGTVMCFYQRFSR